MHKLKTHNTRRLVVALVGGVAAGCLYKLYLYKTNREQFEDSNLLISIVFVLIATGILFLALTLISVKGSSK